MNMANTIASAEGRKTWIEPNVIVLAVSETALTPSTGADGETRWVDCTS